MNCTTVPASSSSEPIEDSIVIAEQDESPSPLSATPEKRGAPTIVIGSRAEPTAASLSPTSPATPVPTAVTHRRPIHGKRGNISLSSYQARESREHTQPTSPTSPDDQMVRLVARDDNELQSMNKALATLIAYTCVHNIPCTTALMPTILSILTDILRDPSSNIDEVADLVRDSLGSISMIIFMHPSEINQVMEFVKTTCTRDESWKVRSEILLFMQSFAYRHQFHLASEKESLFNMLISLLRDPQVEVRELASMSLSGFLTVFASDEAIARMISQFKGWANSGLKRTKKGRATEQSIIVRHSGVLGLGAIALAFPYDIPDLLPEVLVELANHANDPTPIQATVRKIFSEFWKTHLDMWHLHRNRFTEDQLLVLNDLLVSPS